LRRPQLAEPTILKYEDLTIEMKTRTVTRGTDEIELSAREFDLLVTLTRSPHQVFTREQLLSVVWGLHRDVKLGNVETYISYLRAKIDSGRARRLIKTIRGVGYSLR
jgi:DNA-binding response OmpR family regulator